MPHTISRRTEIHEPCSLEAKKQRGMVGRWAPWWENHPLVVPATIRNGRSDKVRPSVVGCHHRPGRYYSQKRYTAEKFLGGMGGRSFSPRALGTGVNARITPLSMNSETVTRNPSPLNKLPHFLSRIDKGVANAKTRFPIQLLRCGARRDDTTPWFSH